MKVSRVKAYLKKIFLIIQNHPKIDYLIIEKISKKLNINSVIY